MSHLRRSLGLTYAFAFIFGATPFIWKKPPLKPIYETLIVSLVVLIQLTTCSFEVFGTFKRTSEIKYWRLEVLIYFMIKGICALSNLIIFIKGMLKRKSMQRILTSLEHSDLALVSLGVRVNHRKERIINLIEFIIGNILILIFTYVAGFIYVKPGNPVSPWLIVWFVYSKNIYGMLLYIYVINVQRAIMLRNQALNEALRKHFLRYQESEVADKEGVLLSICTLHGNLEMCFRQLSRCFGIQVKSILHLK